MVTPNTEQTQPTPGPWGQVQSRFGQELRVFVAANDGACIAEVYGSTPTEAEANARLIIAVHDLLAACKDSAIALSVELGHHSYCQYCERTEGHDGHCPVPRLLDAIAVAEATS